MAISDLLDLLVKPDLAALSEWFYTRENKKACKERNKYYKESIK